MADLKPQPLPDVELDQSTLDNFKKIVSGFPEAQRKQFSDNFNSVDDPSYKLEIIHNVLSDHSVKSGSENDSLGSSFSVGGLPGAGVERGVQAIKNGLTPQDIPHVLSKTASSFLYGAPEFIANNPIAGVVEQGAKFTGAVPNRSVFPRSVTPEGEKLGNEMGFLAGLVPASDVLSNQVIPAGQEVAKNASNRLMNSVLKPTVQDIQKNPEIGYQAAKAGLTGTSKQIADKADKLITANENKLQNILDQSTGTVDASKVADVIDGVKRPFENIGDKSAVSAIEELQNTLRDKGTLSAKDANILKRDFYTTLKDSNYGTAELPAKTLAKKAAARGLKVGIENAEPGQPIAEINSKLGLAGKVGKLAEKVANSGQRKSVTGLIDTGLVGGSLATGNPAPAILAGLRHVAGSDYVKSKLAEILSKLT